MDKDLTEKDIQLGKKIHDVGFQYIRDGRLTGDKLLYFLGIEEAFYVEGQINDIIATNIYFTIFQIYICFNIKIDSIFIYQCLSK